MAGMTTAAGSRAATPAETWNHAGLLAGSLAILLLAWLLPAAGVEQGVRLPGLGFALPATCVMAHLTETGCPACGLTRGFVLAAHGAWRRAAAMHPLATPLFLFCLLNVPLRAALWARRDWARRFQPLERRLWLGLVGALLLVWLFRLSIELARFAF